jgi:hypothetical protein
MVKNMTTIIEKRKVERDFGFLGTDAIIDHEKHGRLLIRDGYGGENGMQGGAVRFQHGMVVKLCTSDTFADLDKDWNEFTSVFDAVVNGYDTARPIKDWDGKMITKLAESLGL